MSDHQAQKEETASSPAKPLADLKFPEKKNTDDDDSKNWKELKSKNYNSSLIPDISLKQGLQKKADPLALSSWVKLALTLDGRDKITKICQYASRMLAWWFIGSNQMQRFKALQTSLTNSRKAFRLGRSVIELHKIRESGFLEIFFDGATAAKESESWKEIGNALKMIGLCGFWAGDNVNFLSISGLFDDYSPGVSTKERLEKRDKLKTNAALFANRFYFFGAVAGLITGIRAYWTFRQTKIKEAHERLLEATKNASSEKGTESSSTVVKEAKQALDAAQEQQFSLFLVLLKVSTLGFGISVHAM